MSLKSEKVFKCFNITIIMSFIKTEIRDLDIQVIQAYKNAIKKGNLNIPCYQEDIFNSEKGSTLVSPANTYGIMDGGLDQEFLNFFGYELQTQVLNYLDNMHEGKLDIGKSQIIPTNHNKYKHIIITPTIEKPGFRSSPKNIYDATKSIINETTKFNKGAPVSFKIKNLVIPGLGTGFGDMIPQESANAFVQGYKEGINELQNDYTI